RLLTFTLRSDPIVAFVGLGHPWAGRESIELADLDDMPLVLREPDSITRRTFDAACSAQMVEPRVLLELDSREAVTEAVAAEL
ncbi:LysR substrate-binding domain-containing protein, partial [Pseudomonas sp. 30_B]|uniref:LysR substrate-binding domain-containing protein n=1 Tax=Pseudomonas sp. 30_B TaxID=2813575 RepID=UPI001FAEFCD2